MPMFSMYKADSYTFVFFAVIVVAHVARVTLSQPQNSDYEVSKKPISKNLGFVPASDGFSPSLWLRTSGKQILLSFDLCHLIIMNSSFFLNPG